jgi:hypothetical protein
MRRYSAAVCAGSVDQPGAGAALVGEFLFEQRALARQEAGNSETGLDRGEELGLLLHHLGKTFFDQAVEHFVDFLPRHMRAGGKFEGLEFWMAEQHQVRAGFVSVQTESLQPAPKSLKFHLGQFVAHGHP